MTVHRLPAALLVRILRYCYQLPAIDLDAWRSEELPLTWVCRRWRYAVSRDIFNRVIIDCSVCQTCMQCPHHHTCKLKLKDNIECIAAGNGDHNIRRLVLIIDDSKCPQKLVNYVSKALNKLGSEWDLVKSLYIVGKPHDAHNTKILAANEGPTIRRFAERFVRLVPNVQTINLINLNCWKWQAQLSQQLFNMYSNNISDLRISLARGSVLDHTNGPENIIRLDCTEFFAIIAKCFKTLESLRVTGIPYTINWSELNEYTETNRLVFGNLNELAISYSKQLSDYALYQLVLISRENPPSADYPVFLFPAVSLVILENLPPVNPFVLSKENFSTAHSVAFMNEIEAVCQFSTRDLPNVDRLDICIDHNNLFSHNRRIFADSQDAPFYRATNSLFDVSQLARHAALKLDCSQIGLIPAHTQWTSIVSLDIAHIGIDVLLALLFKMPNVSRMVARSMGVRDTALDQAKTFARTNNMQHQKLNTVFIYKPLFDLPCELRRAVHLLLTTLTIHSLEYVAYTSDIMKIIFEMIIREHPHLSKTALRVRDQ